MPDQTGTSTFDVQQDPPKSGQQHPRAARIDPVHTAVLGRARLHVTGLRGSPDIAKLLERGLSTAPGIDSASVSAVTGNVLIHFDIGRPLEAATAYIGRILSGEISSKDVPDEAGALPAWHRHTSIRVARELNTRVSSGLSQAAVQERLDGAGYNVLPRVAQRSGVAIFAVQFQSLPVALLAGAAVLSIVTGSLTEAVAIVAVAVLNGIIGYQTESRAESTIQSLGASGPKTARVRRDGKVDEISTDQVVPGDVLVIKRGDVVPADARLASVRGLTVSEAVLTGESLPVIKSAETLDRLRLPLGSRTNMVYRSTIVTGGSGTAIVVATGARTEVGRIQRLLSSIGSPETPIQHQLGELGRQLVWLTLAASGSIFAIGWLRGFALFQMVRSALSTAVAAVPEGLPMVSTTTLAFGIEDMRRRDVLVRKLHAIETLAAVQVICFDKTGTLTLGKMSVDEVATGNRVYRTGPETIRTDSASDQRLSRLLTIGCLCNETQLEEQNDKLALNGSATEIALVQAALDSGINVQRLRDRVGCLSVQHRTEAYRFMVTEHCLGDEYLLAVKGSPQELLARCSFEVGEDGTTVSLTPERRSDILEMNACLAERGLRVLGFAFDLLKNPPNKDEPPDNLVWIGLAGLADPIRPGLRRMMEELHRAGLQTIMLTGDQYRTARSVAAQIGLNTGGEISVLDASDLHDFTPSEFAAAGGRPHAFSRVSPIQKLQIVRALQGSGNVVAMVGDGINDGPALRAADIGIGLGRDGGAAAHEVADVFLATNDLNVLVHAVKKGRATYTNIRKAIRYILSTNLSEIMLMLTGTGVGLVAPLSPLQLLWINLISDVLPGIGLALEEPSPELMNESPKARDEPIVATSDFGTLGREASIITAGAFSAAVWGSVRHGLSSPQTQTMTFGSLVIAQLLHALTCRSPTIGLFSSQKLPPNPALSTILIGSVAAQSATLLLPGMRRLLGVAPIGWLDLAATIVAGVLPYVANEALKQRTGPDRDGLTFVRLKQP